MKKASFIVYHDIEEQTAIMTDEQIGQLFRAMLRFSKGGEPVIDDPFVALAFSFVRPTMERDRKKYEDTCKAHQEAGRMGGRPRKNQTAKGAEYSPTKSSEQPPPVAAIF